MVEIRLCACDTRDSICSFCLVPSGDFGKKKVFFLRVHILCLYIDVHRDGRINREGRKFDITLDFHTNHNCIWGRHTESIQWPSKWLRSVVLFFLFYHCSVQSESLLTMSQIASNHHSIQVHSPGLILMIRILNFKMAIEKNPLTFCPLTTSL